MSLRPSIDLIRVCRAIAPLLGSLILLSSAAQVRAQVLDAGAPAARAPTTAADAGAQLADINASAATAPSAAMPVPPPTPGPRVALSDSRGGNHLDQLGQPVSAAPDGEHSTDLKYLLERIEVLGNRRTKVRMVKDFVPLEVGTAFDVSDPEIEALRYRLLGTGWYDKVELSLQRGKRPGWVVLVIQVEERRTLVFQELTVGLGWSVKNVDGKKAPSAHAPSRKAEPYLGLALADTNFLGTGKTLGGELLVSRDQQGFALGYNDPVVSSSNWGLRTRATFLNGQEYFGGDENVEVSTNCPDPSAGDVHRADECQSHSRAAVVDYWRAGLSLGTARDVGSYTRFTLDWRGDFVYVPSGGMPDAAQEQRGRSPLGVHAIDFAIEPGASFVSTISLGLTYDKRDSAILTSRGTLASFLGDLASPLIGSDYQFVRLQAHVNQWFQLRWQHTIRIGLFAGAVIGQAPFFYKFFVTDLTDLQPSRILGLNLDHRPAPNLFGFLECGQIFDASCGTAIAQMRQEELAARIDVEYVWPLVRGRRKFLRAADVYFVLGLYTLADPDDFRVAMPGYSGISRLPVDLTADVGFRLNTQIGVFQIGFAKWFAAAAQ